MTTTAATPRARADAGRALGERLVAVLPLVTLFAWAALVYAWQAWLVVTPTIFTDELEVTQLARSIAESGLPARRGETYLQPALVPWLTAPAWLVGSTETAYLLAKLLGVLAMAATVFPTYALARLLVSSRLALVAAGATVATPAMVFGGYLLEEPFAYLWSTLALWLIVRAFVVSTPRAFALAAGAALVAPLVRTQLAVIPAVLLAASLVFAFRSERARAWRSRWSTGDRVGAVVLGVGALVLANVAVSSLSTSWQVATSDWKGRMLEYGLWAGGALTIGLGVVPVVAGILSLAWARRERTPEATAFATVLAASLVGFGFYTAVKAAYLSTVFATRVAERNLIYLVPLLFVATVAWLARPRLTPVALAAGTALAATLLVVTPLVLDFPYFEAPGYSLLVAGNRELAIPEDDLRTWLYVVLGVAVVALAAVALLRRHRRASAVLAGTLLAAVVAWNAAGDLQALAGTRASAELIDRSFPDPPDWVDEATGGAPVVYLGQQIVDPNGVHLTEFWNRSVEGVWSLDGTAPAVGPVVTPDLAEARGVLFPDPQVPYVLADGGIEVVGEEVARRGAMVLYRVQPPLRLAHGRTGIYQDGWMGEASAYNQFATQDGTGGTMKVTVSREAGGANLPGTVTVRLGTLVIGEDRQPAIGEVIEVRRFDFEPERASRTFAIPTPPPPFRVEVEIAPTFVPAEVDSRSSDRRALGAQVGYAFEPR